MLVRALTAVLLLTIASISQAKPPHITSVYTKLSFDRCTVARGVEGERLEIWQVRRCEGYAGLPLFWESADGRDDLDVGVENGAAFVGGAFHGVGETVEWRLADTKPFAIIYRVQAESESWSRLVVETIGKPGKPGCPVAAFDALKPNANVAARKAADAAFRGQAKCLNSID